MSVVRVDEKGLLIYLNGAKHRPGDISGYAHAHKMDAGGVKLGDKVKASHRSGTPTIRVQTPEGERIWANDYMHEQEALKQTP